MNDGVVYRLDRVSYAYPDGHVALAEATFDLRAGESVCLLGANGCGKSTLLRLLDGLAFPASGEARAFGQPLAPATLEDEAFSREFRRRVALLFQDPDAQLFSPTVGDDVAFGPLQVGLPREEVEGRVSDALRLCSAEGLSARLPHTLSGGEKKRAALAALLVLDPSVLLLDEPFAGLDPRGQVWLLELIASLRARGGTIVSATHDLVCVEVIVERAIVLSEDHRIAADGPAKAILADRDLLLRVNLIHETWRR